MDAHPERPQALFVRFVIRPTIAGAAYQLAGIGADIHAGPLPTASG
jgi:hypothetical protein